MKHRYEHKQEYYDNEREHSRSESEHHYSTDTHLHFSDGENQRDYDHHVDTHSVDYRRWKYDLALPRKEREVIEKQYYADEKYDNFRHKHPYMGEEELSLHHRRFEVEPFFETHKEKAEWKFVKREEKFARQERRHELKHARESREIEEAYRRIMEEEVTGSDSEYEHYYDD